MKKIKEIKDLYKYYHKKYWCYKKSFQHYQKMYLSTKNGSTALVVIGTISGSITLNPIFQDPMFFYKHMLLQKNMTKRLNQQDLHMLVILIYYQNLEIV